METSSTGRDDGLRRILQGFKGAVFVLVLGALGYVAVGIIHNSWPLISAGWGLGVASVMTSPAAAAKSSDPKEAAGTAAAAELAPSAARLPFDYFPDHYVNQATQAEEPAPTF